MCLPLPIPCVSHTRITHTHYLLRKIINHLKWFQHLLQFELRSHCDAPMITASTTSTHKNQIAIRDDGEHRFCSEIFQFEPNVIRGNGIWHICVWYSHHIITPPPTCTIHIIANDNHNSGAIHQSKPKALASYPHIWLAAVLCVGCRRYTALNRHLPFVCACAIHAVTLSSDQTESYTRLIETIYLRPKINTILRNK